MRQYMGQEQESWWVQLWEYTKGLIQTRQEERKQQGLDPYNFTVVTTLGTVKVSGSGFTFTQASTGDTKEVPADTSAISDNLLDMMRKKGPSLLSEPLVLGGLAIVGVILWRIIRK